MIAARGKLKTKEMQLTHLKLFLKHFVITQDEHDAENPFKPLPYEQMPHIGYVATLWVYEKLLCIAKSRQLLITWLFGGAFYLWDAMFKFGRLNIVVDKKEDDAEGTIERARFIYKHLPEAMKTAIPAGCSPQGALGSYCKLAFPDNNSLIQGLPQNPDAIRKNTASNVLLDEMAFKEKAEECYVACLPTVRGGGNLAVVSTPKGQNFFCKVYNDLGDKI